MNTLLATHYEITLDILAFLPLLFIMLTYLCVQKLGWIYRYMVMVLLGWGLLFADVLLIQHLAATYAPSARLREHAASEDGASTVFFYLFGWVIPLAITLTLDMIRRLWRFFRK